MRVFLLVLLLSLYGCAGHLHPHPHSHPESSPAITEIRRDTVWQGEIVIDGVVRVFKGATLTILPGTDVAFVPRDDDRDGLGDGTLIIEGALLALGTEQQPIRFRSAAADPQPGDWLEIRAEHSRQVHLRWCEIRDSAYTLHAHFSRGVLEDSHIHRNIDGCRLGQSSFVIRNCLVERNIGKGINFRNAAVEVSRNIIRHNGSGIFLFESDRASTVTDNNLYGNESNFRLGDFFVSDVHLHGNWWGTGDPQAAEQSIYDRKHDEELGQVFLAEPAPLWLEQTGPRRSASLTPAWQFATGGFVDAPAVAADGLLYLPSWDGRLYALEKDGRLRWQQQLGEVIDAAPALDDRAVYLQSWGRQVLALARESGEILWQFTYPPSPVDDHRQGGLLRVGDQLLVPAWNGTLYSLAPETGAVLWQYQAGSPLRAAATFDGDRLYLPDTGGGVTALSLDGQLLWQVAVDDAPLLAAAAVTPQGPVLLSRDGLLLALDRDGRERWRQPLAEPCHYAAPLYHNGALLVATAAGTLWTFTTDGQLIRRYQAAAPFYATPLVAGHYLLLGDNGGTLRLLDVDSGDLLASATVGADLQGTPLLLDGGRIIVGSRDHGIHAFDLASPARQP